MAETLKLQGELTRVSYTQQLTRLESAVKQGCQTVDLAEIAAIDSSAVALWVESKRRFKSVQWVNFPVQMVTIAELVGVDLK
jgi:ABC-type transporter Mla MlaB component